MSIFNLELLPARGRVDFWNRARGSAESRGHAIIELSSTLPELSFNKTLDFERRRAERSRRPLLLMLVDVERLCEADRGVKAIQKVASALSLSIRDTDICGWYKQNSVLGVILTEIMLVDQVTVLNVILTKVTAALRATLDFDQINQIRISFHLWPEGLQNQDPGRPQPETLCSPLFRETESKRVALLAKRVVDIAASLIVLIVLLPLFFLIAILIKVTSKGPVIFRQPRVGKHGRTFVFLKFRSMYLNNDDKIHREYTNSLITKKCDVTGSNPGGSAIYKITNDPRITTIGRFLRRSSLDELPQLINVLKGEMSLVGPRPPIPYEFASYDCWHRRRVLAAKPGITGLWQVKGRSKTTFDEMVRLDLRYARAWSLWLDFKILLKTPRAIFTGAY